MFHHVDYMPEMGGTWARRRNGPGCDSGSEQRGPLIRRHGHDAGKANTEIGAQFSFSKDTIGRRITNAMAKLRAKDYTHAVTLDLKRGIIELSCRSHTLSTGHGESRTRL